MQIPYFNSKVVPIRYCRAGINGKHPTEITSQDLLTLTESMFIDECRVIALFSPNILRQLRICAKFEEYPSTIKYTLFDNEIGIMGPIRFVMDDADIDLVDLGETSSGIVYSTFLMTLNAEGLINKIINLASSLQ